MGNDLTVKAQCLARLEVMEEQLPWGVEHQEKLPVEFEELFARWTAAIRQVLAAELGCSW